MNLIDAARQMVDNSASGDDTCPHCQYYIGPGWAPRPPWILIDGHDPDCPWLMLPQIVAALEILERMVTTHEMSGYPGYWSEMETAAREYLALSEPAPVA